MPDEGDVTDAEIDSWVEGWQAVDRAAADYLAARIPGVRDIPTDDDARWLDALAETISLSKEPTSVLYAEYGAPDGGFADLEMSSSTTWGGLLLAPRSPRTHLSPHR
jgi:hypothetical protein